MSSNLRQGKVLQSLPTMELWMMMMMVVVMRMMMIVIIIHHHHHHHQHHHHHHLCRWAWGDRRNWSWPSIYHVFSNCRFARTDPCTPNIRGVCPKPSALDGLAGQVVPSFVISLTVPQNLRLVLKKSLQLKAEGFKVYLQSASSWADRAIQETW